MLLRLQVVEKIAGFSKIRRLLYNPFKYLYAIGYRKGTYARTGQEKLLQTPLFWGAPMLVALPAATDIYLTGGKSHTSEIRLARFLIRNLNAGDHFLDVGAHYGYFTLLAAQMVGTAGRVLAFEPTTKSFSILAQNVASLNQVSAFQKAVSDSDKKLLFYEFPNLHSEYNATDVSQFQNEEWYQQSRPVEVEVAAITIDQIIVQNAFQPAVIKIDVEGAEFAVMQGGSEYFAAHAPQIVMEYLEPARNNASHKKALLLLAGMGYAAHLITPEGTLKPVADIDAYLLQSGLESDNIVFRKG